MRTLPAKDLTYIVYMAADNSLSGNVESNLRGIEAGFARFLQGLSESGKDPIRAEYVLPTAMDERIRERLHTEDITARTFHALALHIIQQGSKKVPIVSKLENDTAARHELFIAEWRKQCSEKKAQAKGWRQWLTEEMQWSVPEGNFWDDEKLQRRIASRLDRWVSLMRMHGGAQAEMIASAPEEIRDLFSKRIKLMAPLLKAWKGALKAENAVDFSGLIHQAIVILEKGRFISPWKHILVDEFQDISPQRAALLAALRKQNSQTTLFAVGDDWQAIYRFSGAQMSLTTAFHENFCQFQVRLFRESLYLGEIVYHRVTALDITIAGFRTARCNTQRNERTVPFHERQGLLHVLQKNIFFQD